MGSYGGPRLYQAHNPCCSPMTFQAFRVVSMQTSWVLSQGLSTEAWSAAPINHEHHQVYVFGWDMQQEGQDHLSWPLSVLPDTSQFLHSPLIPWNPLSVPVVPKVREYFFFHSSLPGAHVLSWFCENCSIYIYTLIICGKRWVSCSCIPSSWSPLSPFHFIFGDFDNLQVRYYSHFINDWATFKRGSITYLKLDRDESSPFESEPGRLSIINFV